VTDWAPILFLDDSTARKHRSELVGATAARATWPAPYEYYAKTADDEAGHARREANSTGIVRAMFVLYTLMIVGGIAVFLTVGLTQQ
jgi:hypothetical protein